MKDLTLSNATPTLFQLMTSCKETWAVIWYVLHFKYMYVHVCTCINLFVIRTDVLSKLLPGCPTGGSGGGSKERVWWQVVWYQALSSEHWSAESSQDGQEKER